MNKKNDDDGALWVGAVGTTKLNKRMPSTCRQRLEAQEQQEGLLQCHPSSSEMTRAEAQKRCSRMLHVVLEREIGGMHNVASESDALIPDESDVLAAQLQLEVELSRPTVAALTTSSEFIIKCEAGEQRKWTPRSRTAVHTRVSEDVTAFRKTLHTCWDSVDIAGGITDGQTPPMRSNTLALVMHGLRGERALKRPREPHPVVNAAAQSNESSSLRHEPPSAVCDKLLSLLQSSSDDSDDCN
jgi:hypothetical protein